MIISRAFVVLTLLHALTNATASTSLRNMQETTLGAAFLAIAKNYTQSSTTPTQTKSGYISADLEASQIGPLATAIDPLCEQFDGYVESESQSGNETETTFYSLGCRLPADKFDMFVDAVIAVLEDDTYSYSFSSYPDGFYPSVSNPAMYVAQQKALENLMKSADTIEDLMLIVSAWQLVIDTQSYLSSNPTSSISINLNQIFNYPEFTDDFIFFKNNTN